MTDKTAKPGELLSRFPEINFSNYGQQEVEALQTWALEAFDALSATLSPAHIEDGEDVEVVATVCCSKDGDWYIDALHPSRVGEQGYLVEGDELMTLAQHQRIVAALSAPPAAGVPIGMACKINGYWEAQLFAGHGCIDRQSLYAHPLPPADVPTGLAHRLLKAYDHGDTGAIEAAIEDIRTMLAAAPTPPASEQQRAVVMPEFMASADGFAERLHAAGWRAEADAQHSGMRELYAELLRLNPHLAKGEGVSP